MKRTYLVVSIIIAVLLILGFMYFYANFETRENYSTNFDRCVERAAQSINEITKLYPEAKECIDSGGCPEGCGSGCGPPKRAVGFFEMFDFYFGERMACFDVCTHYCLYPLEK